MQSSNDYDEFYEDEFEEEPKDYGEKLYTDNPEEYQRRLEAGDLSGEELENKIYSFFDDVLPDEDYERMREAEDELLDAKLDNFFLDDDAEKDIAELSAIGTGEPITLIDPDAEEEADDTRELDDVIIPALED